MTTTGSICGLINLEGVDDDGNVWNESGIDFLIANGNTTDCDGNCINDLDEDLVCDEVDDCVGEYDECGMCNGIGPEEGSDCDGNCIEGYTPLTLIWTGGLNATFSVTGDISGLLYTAVLTAETGYLTECWLTDLQSDCFTINIEGSNDLIWELYSGELLILEGTSDNMFFGSQCETGCTNETACNYNVFSLIDDDSCAFPGDECILPGSLGPDFDYGVFDQNCECTDIISILEQSNDSKKLIIIVDILGQVVNNNSNRDVLFYLFDDGSIETKYFLK